MREVVEDVVVRRALPGDARAIARIYVDTWRDTYRDILPAGFLDAMSVDAQARAWRQIMKSDLVLVAAKGKDVVGFCSAAGERDGDPFFRVEINTLYVTPALQRRGIGGHLLQAMLQALWSLAPVLVWVLEENAGARSFYEKQGAVPVRRASEVIGGRRVEKVAYAWFDA
jgi:GNAT superfamily N-acetyltransferase